MKQFIWILEIAFFSMLVFSIEVGAQTPIPCSTIFKDISVSHSLATAGSWANLRSAEGSLKYETQQMLLNAIDGSGTAKKPENLCPENCSISARPRIVFQSVPAKFLSSYSDSAKCQEFLVRTKNKPIEYRGKQFKDIESLNSWFGDFSQGKGEEGEDLYAKCDGDCSPQYTNLIDKRNDAFLLDAEVICGPARDKSDNQYQLTASYRWQCEDRAN